ncbi:MAG: hypothetical protein A3B89_04945 [Candidatus Buchananbacteria bacterium RIFCSPHIGHO2_02_FULL_40_13]|nr:MAG: hypothetical protein A2820_00270 [Candidatus Buchananbacteria bacterium RIFCSPHIGHO2_01_FULL_40_35]OGY49789.1 MAG: hypothetical protein A3B89_04945 [Candidatus Buchananbacteria bacterium RIFCSPHIGHO2_02_FULL_40_13]
MNDFDIPIFKKVYELYKNTYEYRKQVNRQDRFTIWQRNENLILELLEYILTASQISKIEKLPILEQASVKLNFLRVFLRLMKELKIIDTKKYITMEQIADEIGRMLGGWIKSTKER